MKKMNLVQNTLSRGLALSLMVGHALSTFLVPQAAFAGASCEVIPTCARPIPDGGFQHIFIHPSGQPYVTGNGLLDDDSLGAFHHDTCFGDNGEVERLIATFSGSSGFNSKSLTFRETAAGQTLMAQAGSGDSGSGEKVGVRFFDATNAQVPVHLSSLELYNDARYRNGSASGDFVSDTQYLIVTNPRASETARAKLIDISNLAAPQVLQDIALPSPSIQNRQGATIADNMATNCLKDADGAGLTCVGLKTLKGVRLLNGSLTPWVSDIIDALDIGESISTPDQSNVANAMLRRADSLYLARTGVVVGRSPKISYLSKIHRFELGSDTGELRLMESIDVPLTRNPGSTLALAGSDSNPHLYLGGAGSQFPNMSIFSIAPSGALSYVRHSIQVEGIAVHGSQLYMAQGSGTILSSAIVDPANPIAESPLESVDCLWVGDTNCDQRINNFDVDSFLLALTDVEGYQSMHPACHVMKADVNEDGVVNNLDIDPMVEALRRGY